MLLSADLLVDSGSQPSDPPEAPSNYCSIVEDTSGEVARKAERFPLCMKARYSCASTVFTSVYSSSPSAPSSRPQPEAL
jgi:hypothetical protein